MTTVICLDDYHCLDRYGRKDKVHVQLTSSATSLKYKQSLMSTNASSAWHCMACAHRAVINQHDTDQGDQPQSVRRSRKYN